MSHHPTVDFFAFSKQWWQMHQREVPDMVLGKDIYWPRVLTELFKANGGIELPLGTILCKNKA